MKQNCNQFVRFVVHNLLILLCTFTLAGPILGSSSAFASDDESTQADDSIGKKITNLTARDFRGADFSLESFKDKDHVVVMFMGTECPIVKLYASRLNDFKSDFEDKGVQFVIVNSNIQDSVKEIGFFVKSHELEIPILKDAGNKIADHFGAQRTPEVFVLDKSRKVVYHGSIDDQYHYGVARNKDAKEYLRNALNELVAGKPVSKPATEVVGCQIGRVLVAKNDSKVTYSNQISRILMERCVNCHRKGEVAPFALTDYNEVVGWAEMIEEVVKDQRMPPWHANPEHGKFSNDSKLSEKEKQLIYTWVKNGAPKGDPKNLPEPKKFTKGWQIGKPDVIIPMRPRNRPFKVPATGTVKYQHFVVDPGFKEDKWIKAAECRPGNREVVHHIIVAPLDDMRNKRRHGGLSSEWLCATAPGAKPLMLPDGYAKFVPKGSKLVFQLHYTPNGKAATDLSEVGFIFADPKTVKKRVYTQEASNHRFRIPPGEPNHKVEAYYRFKQESQVLALFPHMHWRGKSFKYIAKLPDGTTEVLLDVPAYDFNWQNAYILESPKTMPKGTTLHCIAHFDNSEDNFANPDPTETVRWGDQTWEEMMIGYFDIVLVDQDLQKSKKTKTGSPKPEKP